MGEYAVLEGAPAYVASVCVRAYAHAPREIYAESVALESPFVRSSLAVASDVLQIDIDALTRLCPVISTCGFTAGPRKLGLGSSAAVVASLMGYFFAHAGRCIGSPSDRQELLRAALQAHKHAQSGAGSGGDVAASVLGGVVRVDQQTFESIAFPSDLHVAFFDAGQPAQTTQFLKTVQRHRELSPAAYTDAMKTLRDAVAQFELALQRNPGSREDDLLAATQNHNRGLAQLQAMSGAIILTPEIEQILDEARKLQIAAKPSGAGGGDLVVAFSADPGRLDQLAVALHRSSSPTPRAAPRALIDLHLDGEGIREEASAPLNSRFRAFFKKNIAQRRQAVQDALSLDSNAFDAVSANALGLDAAEHMIENVVGLYALPFSIATNFRINGRDALVPMCVEEASVVAAASNAARMIRDGGGFRVVSDPPWMITQIQLVGLGRGAIDEQVTAIEHARNELLECANAAHPRLIARGGGARGLEIRVLDRENLVVHVLVDCRDAMGANLLNTIAEALAPQLEDLTGRAARLRILSNLADRRVARVEAEIPWQSLRTPTLDGESVARGIEDASRFAELDPYRATTHNKGIMNGVDAVVMATGNDWRAMEASAHAFAVQGGRYRPLATWRCSPNGTLLGEMTLPVAVGVVGGATRSHPGARLALEILEKPNATRLGQVLACAGLASNLAALRALATEGISRGHMSLHARSVALSAGAKGEEIESLAQALIDVGEIKLDRAQNLLQTLRAPASC